MSIRHFDAPPHRRMAPRELFPDLPDGRAVLLRALAIAATPPDDLDAVTWAEQRRKVSRGRFVGDFRIAMTPYLRRPMELASVTLPCPLVVIRGPAQSGKTTVMENVVGHMIDVAPRPALAVLPTLDLLKRWADQNFDEMVRSSPALQSKVLPMKDRDGHGSTTFVKRYAGTGLWLINGNASTGLQNLTAGYLFADEVDEVPLEAGERGDPLDQAEERLTSYDVEAKRLYVSTPGALGVSRITKMLEAGTFEQYYMPCPHCGSYQLLDFANMREIAPDAQVGRGRAVFACVADDCGRAIEHDAKHAMVAAGAWIATYLDPDPDAPPPQAGREPAEHPDNPRPAVWFPAAELARWQARPAKGRHPSFHFWQAISPFVSWDTIWAKYLKAKADPAAMKVFYQQTLAQPFEFSGDRPNTERLLDAARTGGIVRGRVPSWACLVTLGADVQIDRIVWGVYAWGPQRGALIDHGVCEGEPSDTTHNGPWWLFAEVLGRRFSSDHLEDLALDAAFIDANYATSFVYRFVRGRAGICAARGKQDDPYAPPVGQPTKQKIREGALVMGAALLYPIGGYGLTKTVYHGLAQWLSEEAGGPFAPGALALHAEVDAQVVSELTAEFLDPNQTYRSGLPKWVKPKHLANEHLDIAKLARAAAVWRGLEKLDARGEEGWRPMFAERAKPDTATPPMERLWTGGVAKAPQIGRPRPKVPAWAEKLRAVNG